MFSKKIQLFGALLLVCVAAIIAMPAFAASPAHNASASHPLTGAGESKILGFAENLTTSLQQKGVDVSNLNAALQNARNAIASSDSTAFRDAMKIFNQDIQAGIKDGSIPKTVHQGIIPGRLQKNGTTAPVMNNAMETKMLGFGENVTASLQQKGVDVTNLNAALQNAQGAIRDSNTTAFKDAMKVFSRDLSAGIKSGTITKSDLPNSGRVNTMGNHSFALTKSHMKNNPAATA